jgi:hypothetical protein
LHLVILVIILVSSNSRDMNPAKQIEKLIFPDDRMLNFQQKDNMLFPLDKPTKDILKVWQKSNLYLDEKHYDTFLRFVSNYGLGIQVEQL